MEKGIKEKVTRKNIHPVALIILITLIVAALTYIVPAGTYERAMDDVSGKLSVVPGTSSMARSYVPAGTR